MNILTRKNIALEKDNKTKNKKIKIVEKNKIKNFWETILQPKNANIDRGASTKLKIDKETFKGIHSEYIQEKVKEENQNKDGIEINQNISKFASKKNIKKIIKKEKEKEKENGKKEKKNKILIQTDLPSFDLEPDKILNNDENESIKKLRKEYEIESALKKEKEEKAKKLTEQKKLYEKEEETSNKKINVNSNANIVKIKQIKLEDLIAEFTSIKSQSKELGRITDINLESQSRKSINRNSIKIEINENPDYQFHEERTDRKRKKFNNQHNHNNTNINIPHNNNKKTKNEKKEIENIEKIGSKYASGSNFNLIKLECGVELTENRKKKSGGKNYFEKYGRFSYELYKNRLNKTMSENFMIKETKEIVKNSLKKEENENDYKRKDVIKKSERMKKELVHNKELIREKSDYDAKFGISNIGNNYLNLKTKNLEIVMNNLDLMKDFELDIKHENKYTNNTKYNFFKNKINQNIIKSKKDLREINDFNKTVMGNNLWGEPTKSNLKHNVDLKPSLHLFYNIKKNIEFPIIGLPRQRLPHISSNYFNNIITEKGTNSQKYKIKNLSKYNIFENKRKSIFT